MDQDRQLGASALVNNLSRAKHLLWLIQLTLLMMMSLQSWADAAASVEVDNRPAWADRLEKRLLKIDRTYSGDLGVLVKDLDTGVSVSLRADESWYLASGIKVPVAMAVLRDVELGKLALDSEIHLLESDYVDGAGPTNWAGPGSPLAVRYLLEQMLTVSDNTASDVLIRTVGLDRVNALVGALVPDGLGPITSLADVRRHMYSQYHQDAFKLAGRDFLALRKERDEQQRVLALAKILGLTAADLAITTLDNAFTAYYATNLNGGRLTAYGALLEALVTGQALGHESTGYLIDTLTQTKTGAKRIKAGLPPSVVFAHKTGTQHRRICDLGVAMSRKAAGGQGPIAAAEISNDGVKRLTLEPAEVKVPLAQPRRVLIAACSRDFERLPEAEAALRAVGEAVNASGVLANM